jgi:hypothetical protein
MGNSLLSTKTGLNPRFYDNLFKEHQPARVCSLLKSLRIFQKNFTNISHNLLYDREGAGTALYEFVSPAIGRIER